MNIKRYIVSLSLTCLLASCGGGSSSTTSANTGPAAAAAQALPVGKPGAAEGVTFTVTAVATPKQIGPAGVGLKAEPGETFVVINYTLKNTGTKALGIMDRPGLTLVDGKGQTYAPDNMATPMAGGMMDDPSGMATDLNPNVSAKTKAAWKVDKASFDKANWKLVVATDPQLTFSLQ